LSYSSTRDSEQLRLLGAATQDFIWRYQSHQWPRRRTLFLFPGGMGCQLLQALTPYDDNVTTVQTFNYDIAWLTPLTFLYPGALTLGMHHDVRDAPGVERDFNNRIVIADGAVELFGVTPYDLFTQWCELNELDWFVFGWDWRRRLEDTTALFLQFLPQFRSTVISQCGADPLADFVLVGHSFGGMVVNLLLHHANALLDGMSKAVTVAAPFYGYDGQIHRWFEGEQYFNWSLGKMNVIKAISSMPACYTLSYLDQQTYNLCKTELQGDPDYPLTTYPSDFVNSNPQPFADPFYPVTRQYPDDTDFRMNLLIHGRHTFQQLALPPLPRYIDKFFNIRGVQTHNNAVVQGTVQGITWQLLGIPPHDPAVTPIVDDQPLGPGDDTQPAWSPRHALLPDPAKQWVTVRAAIDHMFMMEFPETQLAVAGVL
jgi:pimeloyl-ACP methyl ester carboxylesterase